MGCWYDLSISPFFRDRLNFSLDLWNYIVIMYYMLWSLYGHLYPSRCILHLYLWRVSVLAFCCYFLDLQNSLVAIDKKKRKEKKGPQSTLCGCWATCYKKALLLFILPISMYFYNCLGNLMSSLFT